MGIFGGGGFLGSGAKTTQSTANTQVHQEDYSGTVAREGSILQITQRTESPEAIEAARQIGLGGLVVGSQAIDSATRAVVDSTDNALGTIKIFGDKAFGTVERALGSVSGAYSDAADYQDRALSKSLDFADGILSASQKSVNSTVTALQDISREQNKSTDQRVAEISGNAIKYVSIAVGAIGLGFVAWAALRGSK